MNTMIRPAAPARVGPGQLLGARQLAGVVRRLATDPADWLGRVRLNPEGRWYERIHLDDSHEVWVISWLPGQATGFHDHGGSAGAFAVVWGTLVERRVVGARITGQVVPVYLGFFLYGIGLGGGWVLQELIWTTNFGRISLGMVRGLAQKLCAGELTAPMDRA